MHPRRVAPQPRAEGSRHRERRSRMAARTRYSGVVRQSAWLAWILVVGSCAVQPATQAPSRRPVQPRPAMPADLKEAVELSSAIGTELYLQDKASWIGTDAMLETVSTEDRKAIGGYVTIREGDDDERPKPSWSVIFFSKEIPARVLYEVTVPMEAGKRPLVKTIAPPRPIEGGLALLVKARQAAIEAAGPFAQPINPAVLPADIMNSSGVLVYLLAGTKKNNTVVFGKHFRVHVSSDGTVREVVPLSKSILELSTAAPGGEKLEALIVSHIVTDYPLETHVFASLSAKLPVYVATARGDWVVEGATISFLGPRDRRE